MVIYHSYDEAADHRGDEEIVCGAFHEESGMPQYVVVSANISEANWLKVAFEIRYGRPMSPMEEHDLIVALEEVGKL